MALREPNVWHQVHAQREDGVAAMFLIRDVEPRADQPKIFVVELPYAVTDLSGQPDAAGYRRLGAFQEQWLEPACAALGWTFVAWKSEDGSFFLYLYGAGDPDALLEQLAPFDGELGFFNDVDADWSEYAALRDLVEQSEASEGDDSEDGDGHVHSDACQHDDDAAFATRGIHVIDLTGEPASPPVPNGRSRTAVVASEPGGRRGAPRAAKRPGAASKPAKRRAAKSAQRAAATRTAANKSAKPAAARASSKSAASKPAKRAARSTASKPAARKRARRTATGR
jgi:hypothetical protein